MGNGTEAEVVLGADSEGFVTVKVVCEDGVSKNLKIQPKCLSTADGFFPSNPHQGTDSLSRVSSMTSVRSAVSTEARSRRSNSERRLGSAISATARSAISGS